MLDIKKWLESTEIKVAEVCFIKPPQLPYLIFTSQEDSSGADFKNYILARNVALELYSVKIDKELEKKIENLLYNKAIEFKKERIYIEKDRLFETIFEFRLVEKKED